MKANASKTGSGHEVFLKDLLSKKQFHALRPLLNVILA
jgi:hypothetical protein